MDVECYEINAINDFEKVKKAWKRLDKGGDMTAFQSYDWNVLLANEFFRDDYNKKYAKLYIYTCASDDQVKCIAPLIVQKRTRKISWLGRNKGIYILGMDSYSDYLNFIYDCFDDHIVEILIERIKKDYPKIPLYLRFVRSDTLLCNYLIKNRSIVEKKTTSAYVTLRNDKEEYTKSLSKSTKQNLRTALNRMNRDEQNYSLKGYSRLDNDELVETLMDMHKKRVRTKNSINSNKSIDYIFRYLYYRQKERKEKKYSIIAEAMKSIKGSLTVVVYLNNRPAGYLFGIIDKQAYRIMQNCYDEELSFYSPMFRGAYDFIMQECEEKKLGIEQVDFTRGDEGYKYKLGAENLELVHFKL